MIKETILLVGNFLSYTGGNRSIGEEFAEHLRSVGYSIITTSHILFRPLRLLDMVYTTWSCRNDYKIACIEVYSGVAFYWAEVVCMVLRFIKKPYVLTLHGGNLPFFAKQNQVRVQRLLKSASAVTSPSRYLQEGMYIYRKDIILIPNPLVIKKYPYRLRSVPSPNLIWLRAFHNIYNPQMAPLVIANLCLSYPEIKLTMIGPDKADGAFQETQEIIKKLGLQKNIKIISGIPKSEVPKYLKQADIFINTTNVDNTPVSVLEAMACGLCLVSTDVGGIPYLLDNGQNALLVPPNDPYAMANAVKRILTENGLSERLSSNAHKKTEQFDWSVILPQLEKLFMNVTLAGKG